MLHIMDVADTLVDHIKNSYPQDIAIVAYYGSYAQGTATKRSDLDFFFIPATPKGYRASIQFVMQDISFDFWPISWERAERMATYQETNTSIIADSILLYSRSDEDLSRFKKLQQTIIDMPQSQQSFIDKAEEQLRAVYLHLYKLGKAPCEGNITYYRNEAHDVLIQVLSSLALLNRTYLKSGWGKNQSQIMNFALKPARLEEQMDYIMCADSAEGIRDACEHLVESMLSLLIEEKAALTGQSSYPDRMKGFYEEVKGILDKLKTACETGNYPIAYFWSIGAQDEIARFIYNAEHGYWPTSLDSSLNYQQVYLSKGLPDLVSVLDPGNFAPLHEAVLCLESGLEKLLIEEGVTINRYETLEQFKLDLEKSLEDAK